MATVTLGPGDNYYEISDEDRDQNVNGNNGIDVIVGSSLDNRIHGNHSNDELYGMGGDDNLKGNQGDDVLDGGDGDDVLEGGADNDQLTGGNDADTFKFSFAVQEGDSAGWVLIDTDTILFSNGVTQGTFSSSYEAFVDSVLTDADGDGDVERNIQQNNPADALPIYEDVPINPQVGDIKYESVDTTAVAVRQGQNLTTRYYDATINTYEWQEGSDSVESGDGHDIIIDFEWGVDVLDLSVLTKQQFLDHFSVVQQDVVTPEGAAGTDGVADTVLSITGDSTFSITLAGVNGHTLADWADYIFGA